MDGKMAQAHVSPISRNDILGHDTTTRLENDSIINN